MHESEFLAVVDDPRWTAIVTRDRSADGRFFYSVSTTGVYCRPSCPSRQARPSHVRLHATREEAEAAGFRPCRRCRPELPSEREHRAALVAAACRTIDASDPVPPVAQLAAAARLSAPRFQRLFREVTGLTYRQYVGQSRAARTRKALARGGRITDAVYDAGFGSAGRFYAAASGALGMPPRTYQRGGAGVTIAYGTTTCTLGTVLAARTPQGVCAVMLGDDEPALVRALAERFPRATRVPGEPGFSDTLRQVAALIDAPGSPCALPLDLQGTVFQRRVWRALQAIPAGTTLSYGELARRIGAPSSVRAVAAACGANPVAVIVPCHRVVGADGALTGYRWGVARKQALLERERRSREAGG